MFRPTLTLTVNNAKTALEAGLQAIKSGQTEIDLAQLTAVDSAAVATLLAWQRAAQAQGRTLTFTNLPSNLQSLAQLYGVADLLNTALPEKHRAEARTDLSHH
jgi:phospholipid transport system transporter-binding protein